MARRLTTEEFIAKATAKHSGKYAYSRVNYLNQKVPVTITCPVHGDFQQVPDYHLSGNGCQSCGGKNTRYTTTEFIAQSQSVHGNKYDYSQCHYINRQSHVTIICNIHGAFSQRANDHIMGRGCRFCGNLKWDPTEFARQASIVHRGYYSYHNVRIDPKGRKVTITCPKHGDFTQFINNHLRGIGCSRCSQSKGELVVQTALDELSIPYTTQQTFPNCLNPKTGKRLKFDVFVPDKLLLIEFDGIQHFEPIKGKGYTYTKEDVREIQERDRVKDKFAQDYGYKLLRIPYTHIKSAKEMLIEFIMGS